MRQCVNCSHYTLKIERCPRCGSSVRVPHPAKFSIEDRYRDYRLKLIRGEILKEQECASESGD